MVVSASSHACVHLHHGTFTIKIDCFLVSIELDDSLTDKKIYNLFDLLLGGGVVGIIAYVACIL